MLDFEVASDDRTIQLNGQNFYPSPSSPITVRQLRASDKTLSAPLKLGYAAEASPIKHHSSRYSHQTLQIYLLDLEGMQVKTDGLKIQLLYAPDVTAILYAGFIQYSQTPGAKTCTTSLCRGRAIIAAHVHKIVEAARAQAQSVKQWVKDCCCCGVEKLSTFVRCCQRTAKTWTDKCCRCMRKIFPGGKGSQHNGHHVGHRPHRHNGNGGRLVFIMFGIIRHFVLPLLLGIVGGIFACFVGVAVGRAIASLVNRCHSSNNDSGSSDNYNAQKSEDAIVYLEEKDPLVLNAEVPPQYADIDIAVVDKQ